MLLFTSYSPLGTLTRKPAHPTRVHVCQVPTPAFFNRISEFHFSLIHSALDKRPRKSNTARKGKIEIARPSLLISSNASSFTHSSEQRVSVHLIATRLKHFSQRLYITARCSHKSRGAVVNSASEAVARQVPRRRVALLTPPFRPEQHLTSFSHTYTSYMSRLSSRMTDSVRLHL